MKRSLLTLILCSSFACAKSPNQETVTLTSEILKIVDGTIIDGKDIVQLIRIRIDLRKRLLGAGLSENELKNCVYNGNHYTVKEMAVIEQKLREKGALQGDTYLAMGNSLSVAKRAFLEDIALPILDSLRRAKKYTILLIQESCEKHNRNNSVLLEWAKTDDEHEIEVFLNKVDSFKTLGLFCLDLIHLIGDIIHSCPAAYHQFEEMKQNYYAGEGASIIDQAKVD